MATIKGLLGLFFRGGAPPTPTFVQYTASAPYVNWTTSPAAILWSADDPVTSWSASPVSGG